MRSPTPTLLTRMTWCALGLALAIAGCGRNPVRPAPITALDMTLELSSTSARPDEPITGKAIVTNVGTTVVRYSPGCVTTMDVYMLDPNGGYFHDGRPVPLCAPACCVPLAPRQKLEQGVGFDGKILTWEPTGPSFKYAEPGQYTMIVIFTATAPNGQTVSLERRAAFQWDPR